MFDFLKSKAPELTVTLDRADGVYRPGEVIGITVEVQPAKEMKVRGGRVRVSGTEHFEFCTRVTTTDSDGNTTQGYSYQWARDEFYVEEVDFLGEATLASGTPERFTFQTRLPADAAPTCFGEILRIEWLVEVKLDRPLGSDLNAKVVVRVPALAPGREAEPVEYGASNEPKEAELALVLPGLEAVAGQAFSGRLRVLPHKDFTATEVRLELVRAENVPVDQPYSKEKDFVVKLAGNTKFKAGQQQVLDFQAPLPADAAPSLESAHGTLTWTIKAVLARRLRQDTRIEQVISVFTEKVA